MFERKGIKFGVFREGLKVTARNAFGWWEMLIVFDLTLTSYLQFDPICQKKQLRLREFLLLQNLPLHGYG